MAPMKMQPIAGVEEQKSEKKMSLLKKMIASRNLPRKGNSEGETGKISEKFYHISKFESFQQIELQRVYSEKLGLENPFYKLHEGIARDTTRVEGTELINFATYNYIGLNGDYRVSDAAIQAIHKYGTSSSASRLTAGERPPHQHLEKEIASFLNTQDALVFVSGHLANTSTLEAIAGPKDLIIHDRLIHNSCIMGAIGAGSKRLIFEHNAMNGLEEILKAHRNGYEKAIIVVEGIYSMDGDLVPLPEVVRLKNEYKALLYLDEAHSVGAIGKTGRGVTEHFHIPVSEIDILMGTLSKSFAGCGGFVAGSSALIQLLKYTASGFVYSVGMPPSMAAASCEAFRILRAEPERVQKLQKNGQYFLKTARELDLNTGSSAGYHIAPIIVGSSIAAVSLSNSLLKDGILAIPIIHPGVEERSARLRFFISCDHSESQIESSLMIAAEKLRGRRSGFLGS